MLVNHYLDELERSLGRTIDRKQCLWGLELAGIALWQLAGALFGVMVTAPSAPVPGGQRAAMRERVFSDITHIEGLVRKHGLG